MTNITKKLQNFILFDKNEFVVGNWHISAEKPSRAFSFFFLRQVKTCRYPNKTRKDGFYD